MKSIRLNLIIMLGLAISAIMATGIIMSYEEVKHETEELYDAQLAQISRVLEGLLKIQFEHLQPDNHDQLQRLIVPPLIENQATFDSTGHKYERKLAFQVWTRKGVRLLENGVHSNLLSYSSQPGFDYEESDVGLWRTFNLYSEPLSIWIKVAQLNEIREEASHEIASGYTILLLLTIPIMILMVALIVRRGFIPLLRISNEVSQRSPANLQPLKLDSVPSEVNLLVSSINTLLQQLKTSMDRQKRFTSNAAHELRTPLAGIKIHAQNLQPKDPRTQKIQGNIVQGVDKLTHMFNQLITLSRFEILPQSEDIQALNLASRVTTLIDGFSSDVAHKDLDLQQQIPVNYQLRANPDALAILLRNLIDNAIRYTPQQGSIRITLQAADTGDCLLISDSGPGLNDEQKKLVFDRFFRAASQDVSGCGIGLSIVREICECYGYQIELSDSLIAPHGLTVSLRLNSR